MENKYDENVLNLGDKIHKAFKPEGENSTQENPTKVEYKVAEVLDRFGVTEFTTNGDIADPKIEFELEGQKKVLSFTPYSNEEFTLVSGMDGYNADDLVRIENKAKTPRM